MTDTPDTPDRRPDEPADASQSPADRQPQPQSHWPPMPPVQQSYPGAHGYWQPSVAKPGVIPLRPLTVGDLFGGAIATIRTRPALMLGVTAIVVTVSELINAAATYPLLDDVAVPLDPYMSQSDLMRATGASMAIAVIGMLIMVTSRVFLSGFITQVVGTAVVGHRPGFRALWQQVRPRLLPLLGLTFVYAAVVVPAATVMTVLLLTVPALGVLAMLGFLVVAVWLGVMFSLATPALVLENVSIRRAFGRSRQLVRGSWWRIAGILVLATLVAFAVVLVVTLVFGFATGFSNVLGAPTTETVLVTTIVTIIAGVLTEPFVAAVIVLLYTDQRIRRERLDIELARVAGLP